VRYVREQRTDLLVTGEEVLVGNNAQRREEAVRVHELRVVVAEDDPFARRLVKDALRRAGIEVVGEAENGREAVELVLRHRPDALLMDVVMPELDGVAATRFIVDKVPGQVVILVTHGRDDEALAIASLRAGAAGFLTKDLDVDALPRAVEGAVRGEAAISRRLGMRLVERLRGANGSANSMRPVWSPLTTREWEVLDLLAQGRTTEQIADELVLTTETIRTHVKHILRKLNARSRQEAVNAAERLRRTLATGVKPAA
jgi:two-component system, NarL family, response regulator LiaR